MKPSLFRARSMRKRGNANLFLLLSKKMRPRMRMCLCILNLGFILISQMGKFMGKNMKN